MKSKAIIVSFIAIFVLAFALSVVSATHDHDFDDDFNHDFDHDHDNDHDNECDPDFDDLEDIINIELVEVNGVAFDAHFLSGDELYIGRVSDIVPVYVQFGANDCVDERVRVTAYIDDYRIDIRDSVTIRTPLEKDVNGYTARLSLKLPSSLDLRDELSEDTRLYLRFKAHGFDSYEISYNIRMSKDLESLNILSLEIPQEITAGSTFDVDVVLENNGHLRLDDVYVKASIPELGVEKKIYIGDLESERDRDYDEIRDTLNKRIYLTLPSNTASGSYELEVEAYNYETTTIGKKTIVIGGSSAESSIIASTGAKTISANGEATFNIVLVNTDNKVAIYTISPETVEGLIVEVAESVVVVDADSSKTVKVKVKATSSVKEGTNAITVNVNSESGTVNPVTFTVNVEKGKTSAVSRVTSGTTDPVVIWTIVLVIVFVVLLVILIVLLTKKPVESEEFGETSYY